MSDRKPPVRPHGDTDLQSVREATAELLSLLGPLVKTIGLFYSVVVLLLAAVYGPYPVAPRVIFVVFAIAFGWAAYDSADSFVEQYRE